MKTMTREAGAIESRDALAGAARWLERALWLAWIPLVLYAVFFAPIPDLHDGMHPIRHSSTLVQCH